MAVSLVKPTLGAKSRRILIDSEFGEVLACDDGTTILNKINPEDTQVGIGVKIVREASAKTNTDAGDGTSTTAVILGSLAEDLLKEKSDDKLLFKKESGSNLRLRKEILAGVEKVTKYIDSIKIAVNSKEQMKQIGRVSANDEETGEMLADMFQKLGNDGSISVSSGAGIKTESEITNGMSFDNGWLSQQFITDSERQEAVLAGEGDVKILVSATKINDVAHMTKIAELHTKDGLNDFLIICEDASGIPLNSLVVNKMRDVIRVAVVKSPFGKDTIKDICAFTGATLVGGDDGIEFKDLKMEHFGSADKVVVTEKKTVIIGNKNPEKVKERVAMIRLKLEKEESEYEKKKLRERISKLTGGIGVIKVGGATPMEVSSKVEKMNDAVSAIKSAINGGVVPGGGVALLLASKILDDKIEGELILKRSIMMPFKQIAENSDINMDQEKVLETGFGYNVETEEFGDLIKMGIIDAANVTLSALKNAVSSSLMISNLGGALCLIRDKDATQE